MSTHTLPHTLSPAETWQVFLAILNTRPRIRLADRRRTKVAYPRRYARDAAAYTTEPPTQPAAIHVYDRDGSTRFLPLDLDAHDRTDDQIDAVQDDLAAVSALLDQCGLVHLTDEAHGGAHVYVLLEDRISADEARTLVTALSRRMQTLDPSPTYSASDGLITIPGSAHRLGGHRMLTVDADTAWATLAGPHSPASAVQRLRAALADEIRTLVREDTARAAQARETAREAGALDTLETIPDEHVRTTVMRGIGRHMSTTCTSLATAGDWRAAGYPSPSEARRAVLMSAVATGLSETDVRARMLDGRWPGLRSIFAHKGLNRLHDEYVRAIEEIARRELHKPSPAVTRTNNAVSLDTSAKTHAGGRAELPSTSDVYGTIRSWITLVERHAAAELPGTRGWDRQMVLRSLGQAASMVGSTVIAMGVRWHAVALGVSRSDAAELLRELSGEADPWVVLVARGRGIEADQYRLRVPSRHEHLLEDLLWRSGKTHAVRPVFSVLGRPVGLFFEAIERGNTTRARIALVTGLRADAYREARDTALAYGIVTGNDRDGYAIATTDSDLERLAEALGATEARTRQVHQHRQERKDYWKKLAELHRKRPWIRAVRDVEDRDPEIDALLTQMRIEQLPEPDDGCRLNAAVA